MSGIHPDVITHKLLTCRLPKPVAQKRRRLGEEKRLAAIEETQKFYVHASLKI